MKQSDKSKSDREKEICVSVFKSGGNTVSKAAYTEKWAALIRQLEKAKGRVFAPPKE